MIKNESNFHIPQHLIKRDLGARLLYDLSPDFSLLSDQFTTEKIRIRESYAYQIAFVVNKYH
jgi:hypothetical protein